ncbi:MAG: hypothetical protein RIS76_795 [Verrucomicrobiota bacterium]
MGSGILRVPGITGGTPSSITNRGLIRVAPDSDLTWETTGGFHRTATGEVDITLRISLPAAGTDPALGTAFVILTHGAGSINGAFQQTILADLGSTKKFVGRYDANANWVVVTAP